MAAVGGPDAVVLRGATRSTGVSPNAAYRHFTDRRALLLAVSSAARGLAAGRIAAEVEAVPRTGEEASDARARFKAVGSGYLAFARESPGLFRTAFTVPDDLFTSWSPVAGGEGGSTPFQILSAALDDLVATGALPVARRPGAELLAWSTVHGLGMLIMDGPLRGLDAATVAAASVAAVEMVERGI